jgi:hypothetical protein
MLRALLFVIPLLTGSTDTNQAPPAPSTNAAPATNSAPAPPVLREISPGVFDYHGVRLDKKNRTVSFPGTVSFRQGLIEYLLVNDKGKTYESLLKTTVQPHDIHLALLLIGLKEDPNINAGDTEPPSAIDAGYLKTAPKLKGPPVQLSVKWTQDGKRKEMHVEDWVLNLQTKKPMTPGPWTYNGSMVQDGAFLADQELSIVAVITDPTALVNNTRPGYDNEDIWQVREEVVPPLDTPVEISITLPDSTPPKP